MRWIRQSVKFFFVFFFMLSFLFSASVVWLVVRDRWQRTHVWCQLLSRFARIGLWFLGVRVRLRGYDSLAARPEGILFVGNHLSYLDVLVISAHIPTCFVTSVEIKETPFLGQLCQMAGCLFVERRNRAQLQTEISELSEGLKHRLNVVVFPEATSTNHEQVLRFRRPLFGAAIQAQQPVMPFCLNYSRIDGQPLTVNNRDFVCWYGDMEFAPHLWALTGLSQIDVDLVFCPGLSVESSSDVTVLADQAFERVRAQLVPPQPI